LPEFPSLLFFSGLVGSRLLLIALRAIVFMRLCQADFGNVPEPDAGDCDERIA
jgi:hypothetical protein